MIGELPPGKCEPVTPPVGGGNYSLDSKQGTLRPEMLMAVTVADPIKILFAVLLPPLGVFFEVGLGGAFWLNIVLTILGYIPGIIHALYIILSR